MSSGYSRELNVQNARYFMEFSSCSEKRYKVGLQVIHGWPGVKKASAAPNKISPT